MRNIPSATVELRVKEGIKRSAAGMYEVCQEPDESMNEKFISEIRNLSLFAIAQYELEGAEERHPFEEPRWIEIARLAIEDYAGDDPKKQALRDTPFFNGNLAEWEGLSTDMNSKIVEPWSTNYEGRDFAAAVVLGGIVMMSARERFSAA